MIVAVLDASALLAVLRGEPGAERVRPLIGDTAITTVNFSEVVGHYARLGAAEPDIRKLLDPLPMARVALDEELGYAVGMQVAATRAAGLSLGDRACLALARQLGVRALTADRAWLRIAAAVGVEIELIR